MRALVSWSGGKDSCLALHRARHGSPPLVVALLLTACDETGERVRSHGVPPALVRAQAAALGVADVAFFSATWAEYEARFIELLARCKEERGIDHGVFGDIDIASHREWEEMVCATSGLQCHLPLWQQSRAALVDEFLAAGFAAIVVCVDGSKLGREFCGREFDAAFVRDLPPEVDACGENGEFHTFVYNGPAFRHPVAVARKEVKTYVSPAEYGGKCFYFQVLDVAG